MITIHNKAILGLVLFVSILPAASFAATKAGQVLSITGRVTASTPDGDIRQLRKGSKLYAKETVTTGYSSYTRLKFADGSYIMLRPDSRFVIDDFKYSKKDDDRGFFSLLRGGLRAVTGLITNKKKYKYRTSIATIGIRGTGFIVRVCNSDCTDIEPQPKDGIYVEVTEKTIILSNNAGDYVYHQGQFAYMLNNDTPAVTLAGRPDIFVQSPLPPADPANCPQ